MSKRLSTTLFELIRTNTLHDALQLLRAEVASPEQVDRLRMMEQTYRYMIHYMLEGTPDDSRQQMIDSLKGDLLVLAADIEREKGAKGEPSLYFNTLRTVRFTSARMEDMVTRYEAMQLSANLISEAGGYDRSSYAEAEDLLRQIFSHLWTSFVLSAAERSFLMKRLVDRNGIKELKAQIISALLLANLFFYDETKLTLLLDAYESDSLTDDIAARCLTAIVLILALHSQRVRMNQKIMARLMLWQDSLLTYSRLRSVINNIIRTRQTDRIDAKMREQVIPELLKLRPEIMRRFKDVAKEIDVNSMEENPEWEEFFEKSGIADQLKELQELQMDGGDVMLTSFSNLKSFPFFNALPNWFLPFSTNYSSLDTLRSLGDAFLIILGPANPMMCSSDKFSFALSLDHVPEMQKKMMTDQLKAQMDMVNEEKASSVPKEAHPDFELEVSSYVKDLFRFFRFFRLKSEFTNPLERVYDFLSIPGVGETLSDSDTLSLVGEFYFRNKFYRDALSFYQRLLQTDTEPDPSLYEKIGFCHHALKERELALQYYEKAELSGRSSKWLRQKLAYLNRSMGRYDEAVRRFESLLEDEPENIKLLTAIGYARLNNAQYDKALQVFYKAHYLEPENVNTLRAIALCELMAGNLEKSRSYYEQVLIWDPQNSDYMNAGHLALVEGKYKEAAGMYLQSLRAEQKGFKAFADAFREDIPMLEKLGVAPEIPFLMLDNLRYQNES